MLRRSGAHEQETCRAHHVEIRLAKRHQGKHQEDLRREGRSEKRFRARPGEEGFLRLEPRPAVACRHHLREDASRVAIPGDRDGRVVTQGRRLVKEQRMTADLADDALRMAISRRSPSSGCVHHLDHGSWYASLVLGATLRKFGIRPPRGSLASPWDNAATEPLMGIIEIRPHPHARHPNRGAKLHHSSEWGLMFSTEHVPMISI